MTMPIGIGVWAGNRPLPSLGPELVTNGNFDTSANWTTGTGWTVGAGVASAVATGASALAQTGGIPALVTGARYQVTFTIVAQTVAGDGIAFIVGGGAQSTPRAGIGTYTQTAIAGATTNFQFNAAVAGTWEGSIDAVSVRRIN